MPSARTSLRSRLRSLAARSVARTTATDCPAAPSPARHRRPQTGGGRVVSRSEPRNQVRFELGVDLAYDAGTSAIGRAPPAQGPGLLGEAERARLIQAAQLLRRAERGVRVLRTIAWPPEVAVGFFAAQARELPR